MKKRIQMSKCFGFFSPYFWFSFVQGFVSSTSFYFHLLYSIEGAYLSDSQTEQIHLNSSYSLVQHHTAYRDSYSTDHVILTLNEILNNARDGSFAMILNLLSIFLYLFYID